MITKGLHHVAYRCINAQETVDFYTKVLDMPYAMAMAEDHVPSTHEPDPYMHIFFDIGDGSFLAFFEIPNSPPMGRDENTPNWVQHLALKVEDEDALMAAKARMEDLGVDVLGPTDHAVFKSIYCFDPNGHRLELACNTAGPEVWQKVADEAPAMLEEWNETKSVPKHVAWVHTKEFEDA
ncbi:MAG: VOC family protein [Rhodospirillaceae bacterium]|jgi:glyoxylase I family protein|nr:VOC family protein [Rhodospirillaceae bacterium]MBT4589854.1 VOC family protein [Rhodospirillaceae bacterium]MBT5939156.1 VOC family protein [Rhodospirillaceae bacterium]MBT7267437.1 VOC family protein [Rhodospirillaceae bacterium]